MPKIRKVLLEVRRSTSHVVKLFRFEVPVRKAVNPPGTVFSVLALPDMKPKLLPGEIRPIVPERPADDYGEFDARQAWDYLHGLYGDNVGRVYREFAEFERDFEACVKRDSEGVAVDASEKPASGDFSYLTKIRGIGEELARALGESGLDSVEKIATAELDELESVAGVGPSSAIDIRGDAARIVQAMLDEADPEDDDQE